MKRQALQALGCAMFTLAGLPSLAQAAPQPAKADAAANTGAKIALDRCAKPVWPKEALRKEQTGTVTLVFLVGADGAVLESKVRTSSGYPLLDEAARTGLLKCQFSPAVVNGRAEQAWMQMQYVWRLDGDKLGAAAVAAFEAKRAQAERGDTAAQREIGNHYMNGDGVARDPAQGLAWFEKAADAGDAEARARAGMAYLMGAGVARDADRALRWLTLAAEQGHAQAQAALAAQYLKGEGVPRDEAQAAEWLRKAAAQDLPLAYAPLASLVHAGRGGMLADPAEAERLLRKGAALGDSLSQFNLGMRLAAASSPEEQAEGFSLLRQAAATGLPQMQMALGAAYRDGKGVAQDYAQARSWLGKAAAQSWPAAQFALAVLTEQGQGGARNEAEALKLYEKAAARGIRAAALRLAESYERGELGNPVDPARGAQWRARAEAPPQRPPAG